MGVARYDNQVKCVKSTNYQYLWIGLSYCVDILHPGFLNSQIDHVIDQNEFQSEQMSNVICFIWWMHLVKIKKNSVYHTILEDTRA